MNIHGLRNSNNPNEQSIGQKVKEYWLAIPIFVKIVVTLSLLFYTLSWFVMPQLTYLVNIPYFTVFKFRIWTLVTTVFLTLSIINIIFAFISWVPDAIRLEMTSGTVRYTLNFLVNSILIQLLYVLFAIILGLIISQGLLKMPSTGLWPLIMAEITILCNANPDNEVRMFLIPVPIKSRYYPWALFAFFTLFNMSIQFDILAGICYGYLFFYKLRNYIQFSDNFILKCEALCLFRLLSKFKGKYSYII